MRVRKTRVKPSLPDTSRAELDVLGLGLGDITCFKAMLQMVIHSKSTSQLAQTWGLG